MGYLLGRGCVFIGTRDATGKFLSGQEFHCPEFDLEVTSERATHYNSCSPVKSKDLDIATQIDAKLRMVIDTYDKAILALALGGAPSSVVTGASFTAKPFATGVAVGDVIPVPGGYSNLASLAITDSAATPATLTAGTHYTVDLNKGLVTFLSLGAFTQPFKAAGAEADGFSVVSIATVPKVERFIRFAGVNIADSLQPNVIVDCYRSSIGPGKVMPKASGNDVATFEFAPELLVDPVAPFSNAFGQYGRFVKG